MSLYSFSTHSIPTDVTYLAQAHCSCDILLDYNYFCECEHYSSNGVGHDDNAVSIAAAENLGFLSQNSKQL